jgi:hypothetical protein
LIGTISASSAVAIAVSVASTVVVLMLLAAAVSLRRSARDLRELAGELDDRTATVLADVESSANEARQGIARIDHIISEAEVITETSRLAHSAVAKPLIKLMAVGTGTVATGRRLRDGRRSS